MRSPYVVSLDARDGAAPGDRPAAEVARREAAAAPGAVGAGTAEAAGGGVASWLRSVVGLGGGSAEAPRKKRSISQLFGF
jgi:hypothetical protein